MKLLHHEYWPSQIFYFPILFVVLKNAMKLGSLNYFCWTNPKMQNGGLIGYSKQAMLEQIPKVFCPETLRINPKEPLSTVELLLLKNNFTYPFIAKPDRGARGYRVELIEDIKSLRQYHYTSKADYLIQEFIDDTQEFGVFVVRTEDEFFVSSLVQKEFLSLVGDGKSSLETLYNKHDRASKYYKKEELPTYLDRILPEGKTILLEPIGNHCRGTKFVNANKFIDQTLTDTFKNLVLKMPDFHYGRFDVKANSFEALRNGNFKVMEINGISSEPGHIYDPNMGLVQAYKDLFWHWEKMYEIASQNKKNGQNKESITTTVRALLDYYRNR